MIKFYIVLVLLSFAVFELVEARNKLTPGSKNMSEKAYKAYLIAAATKAMRENIKTNTNQMLLRRLFSNYIKEATPNTPVVVHLDLILFKLKSSLEKEGLFESVLGLFIEWRDTRMTWIPENYSNVTSLTFDADQVWLPDIAMTNSADHLYGISRDKRFVVRVTYDGNFRFVPTGTARTWCDFNLLTFPFDIQTCTIEFESWSMTTHGMTFDWKSQTIVDDSFSSTEWSLCNTKAVTYDHLYDFSNETFTRIQFDMIVKRKSTFYVVNLIFPCTTLSIIQLLVFLISSTGMPILTVVFSTILAFSVIFQNQIQQTIVTAELPKTSNAVTALSKYVIALIMISTLGIIESVLVERMMNTTIHPPPRRLFRLTKYIPILWREKPSQLSESDDDDGQIFNRNRRASSVNLALARGAPSLFSLVDFAREAMKAEQAKMDYIDKAEESQEESKPSSNQSPRKTSPELEVPSIVVNDECTLHNSNSSDNKYKKQTIKAASTENFFLKKSHKKTQKGKSNSKKPKTSETRNVAMWIEVADRLDFFTFTLCTTCAVIIPLSLFLPLVLVNEHCFDNAIDRI